MYRDKKNAYVLRRWATPAIHLIELTGVEKKKDVREKK